MMRGLVPRNRLRTVLLFHDVTELGQRNVLDLADTFSRHLEFSTDFLERLRLAAVEPETQGQNLGFTRIEFFKMLTDLKLEKKKKKTAIVIDAQAYDMKTDPSGNSGERIACGVVTK